MVLGAPGAKQDVFLHASGVPGAKHYVFYMFRAPRGPNIDMITCFGPGPGNCKIQVAGPPSLASLDRKVCPAHAEPEVGGLLLTTLLLTTYHLQLNTWITTP